MRNPVESTLERKLLELHNLEQEIAALRVVVRLVKEGQEQEPSRSAGLTDGPAACRPGHHRLE